MRILLGLAIVFGAVFGGYIMAEGNMAAFMHPAEYLIIFGAGIGALVVGNSKVILLDILHQIKAVFIGSKNESEQTEDLLTVMFIILSMVKKDSIKVLDDHVDAPHDSPLFNKFSHVLEEPILINFITDNLRLISMGGQPQPHEFEALLEKEIFKIEDDLFKPSKSLHSVAEAMPGFGILAAVGGIIITMGFLDGPLAQVGASVATALGGTFIGIFMCYCVLGPLSNAMHEHVERQISQLEGAKAIIISFLEGKSPIMCVDAGRRVIELDIKPSFAQLDEWMKKNKETAKSFSKAGGS